MFFSLLSKGNKGLSEIRQVSKLDAASNAVASKTVAAVANQRHVAHKVYWSYSGDPTGGKLTITGGTNSFEVDITKGGPGALTLSPYVALINTSLVVTLAAGGSGITGKVNLDYHTEAYG